MIRTIRACWLSSALVLASAPAAQADEPAMPSAEPPARTEVELAESLANDAFAAYEEHDYAEAVSLYLRAYETAPGADILFNVARIYDVKLSDRELASRFYRRYIAEPGADPERVRLANQRLAALREIERANADSQARAQESTTSTRSTAPSDAKQGLNAPSIAGISLLAAGFAGLGVGTGFAIAALDRSDLAKRECTGNACRTQRGLDAAKDGTRSADVATVAFSAGAALSFAGAALLTWGIRRAHSAERLALQVAPELRRQHASLSLHARW
jgi:tetratricopeptide (TPR) repeat protein